MSASHIDREHHANRAFRQPGEARAPMRWSV